MEIRQSATNIQSIITRNIALILVTILALAITAYAAVSFSRSGILLAGIAWVSCICSAVEKFRKHPEKPLHDDNDEAAAEALCRLRQVFGVMASFGPHARLTDVKKAIVIAGTKALETNLVALFTIDPCLGGIECECTNEVNGILQTAFLKLAGNIVTDRDCVEPLIIDSTSVKPNNESMLSLVDCGIGIIIACPIRSELGASGALVAFYPVGHPIKSLTYLVQAVAAQASAMISYALAIEQSSNLLDDLAGANQELSVQAMVDGLTGLANHRTFQQTLHDLCRHTSSTRTNRKFSLIMADVDNFKIYNDTHGHQAGDAVLRTVARVMTSKLRQGDLAARYGGEEFALLLRGTDKEEAQAIADRIRSSVAAQPYERGTVTISMGLAEYPDDSTDAGEIIEKADRALYHAKITGRNRIVVWGSASSVEDDDSICGSASSENRCKKVLVIEQPSEQYADDIHRTLVSQSCDVHTAATAIEAIEVLRTQVFDIAFVSMDALPDRNLRALSDLTSIHPQMPVVLITQSYHLEESREALQRGASDTLLRPFNPAELPMLVERNVERCRLERERMAQKGIGLMLQSIDALVSAIDAKDHYTAGHSQRVTQLALAIADELNLPVQERSALEFASRLHDIGKLALPDSALNKQSQLNDQEWAAMRQHTIMGSKIVGAIDELAYVSTIIRHHHERINGTGYPDGLRGEAIPYPSRIIAVADAYEAMTSERSYRAKRSSYEAFEELAQYIGTFYAPEIVNALGKVLIASGELGQRRDRRAA